MAGLLRLCLNPAPSPHPTSNRLAPGECESIASLRPNLKFSVSSRRFLTPGTQHSPGPRWLHLRCHPRSPMFLCPSLWPQLCSPDPSHMLCPSHVADGGPGTGGRISEQTANTFQLLLRGPDSGPNDPQPCTIRTWGFLPVTRSHVSSTHTCAVRGWP